MTAPTKTLRTPAEAELIERFGRVAGDLPGAAAVRARRAQAFSTFERVGLPHRRVEEWKYSDLRARLKSVAPLAARPTANTAADALHATRDTFPGIDRYRLVLVDGFFMPELSDRDALLAEGVEVSPLSDLLAIDGAEAAELLSAPAVADGDVAVALNSAFVADGVVVFVRKGARPTKPIEILNLVSGGAAAAIHVRNRIVAGDDTELTVLESTIGGTEGAQVNLVTEYRVGNDVNLTVARLQASEAGTTDIASNLVTLGKGTNLSHLSVEAGGDFSRNQTFVTFAGEHSRSDIFGVSMVHGTRHVDQTLVVDHAVPHCAGKELFKTVADDRSHGVFQGKIIVRRDAQKTDSKMMSQALLLSEEAEMDAKPELEIFADDVVCGHGATSGQIDRTMLFYLMARGIPRAEAERLLIEAFLDDAVDAIGNEAIAEALKKTISAWLNARRPILEVEAA